MEYGLAAAVPGTAIAPSFAILDAYAGFGLATGSHRDRQFAAKLRQNERICLTSFSE
jgi:hypothetical protein